MKRLILVCASILVSCQLLAAENARLLRHPSYHDGKIAFSYLGDIWVVSEKGGQPARLTVHTARDVYPRFSPDGKWLAFSSDRYGNYDVFLMSAEGGTPKRVTFHSAQDIAVSWTPDSKKILFQSVRGEFFPGIPGLYQVSVEGGLPERVPTDWGYWGSFSPDGKKLAFNRHPMVWWRKHYRGSYAADLWVMDLAAKKFAKLLQDDFEGNYFWPMWGRGEIYFVSDRDPAGGTKALKAGDQEVMQSANNLWKIPEAGGKPVPVTRYRHGNLFWPTISSDGKVIVYENDFGIGKLETATGKTTEIRINIASDDKENNVELLKINSEADSFDLSPSTKRAVISAHGEIFTIATDRGDIRRVTASFSRQTGPTWSPDGKWIAYVSDESGRDELWLNDAEGKNARKLTEGDTQKLSIVWAPDSKAVLYTATDFKLHRVTLETGKDEVLAASPVNAIQNPQFSPDGKWISYTKADPNLLAHVFILPVAGGEERAIGGPELYTESGATWTPDGKRLLFLSGGSSFGPASATQEPNQLYTLSLTKEEKDLFDKGVDEEEITPEGPPAGGAEVESPARGRPGEGRPGGRPEAKKVDVKIDFDGMSRRARQLTRLTDNVVSVVPAPDSKTYAFVAVGAQEGRPVAAIYTIQEDGQKLTRLTQSLPPAEDGGPGGFGFGGIISSLQFSKDGKTLFFRERDGIYSIEMGGAGPAGAVPGRGGERKKINFLAKVEVDHRAEWKQVFEESWRVMKHRFYDPKMHGVDWDRVRAIYEPLMPYVADQEEMHNVVSQMIGELNASHTGISAPRRSEVETRHPGFEMEPDPSGFYKVSLIYKNGPADKDYVKIKVGDYVLAVDGQPLKAGDTYYELYYTTAGRKYEFTVNSKPSLEGAWKTKIVPVSPSGYSTLRYEKWVDDRRAMVERLSRGEIGYLHIRQMNAESLRRFQKDLARDHFKKALIIDQRFNPGGGIDQELLQILSQRQYQYTRLRDSVVVTRPLRAFFGPMVVMQNERSTSDAEVFPQGFKDLKLGKVVGVTTYGAVIGTGSYSLMDGSTIRTPSNGLWTMRDINLENYGVKPDVYVDNTPEDYLAGHDPQLERAVQVLQEELKTRK